MWEKTLFHQYRILSRNFLALLQKIQDSFQNCILRVQGKILRKTIYCFEKQQNFRDFFWFFFVNWSEDLLKQHSKCPEDLLEGKKVSWKSTQSFINFPTWWGSFLDIRQTFSIRLSKLLFMCPEKFFVENLIHQFHILGDMLKDFWQETETTLSFFQNCSLRAEKEFDINSLAFFFTFSAGSPNWALALRSKF